MAVGRYKHVHEYILASRRQVREPGTNRVPMAREVTADRHAEFAHARMSLAMFARCCQFGGIMHFHWKVLPQEIVCTYDSRLFLTHKKYIFKAMLIAEFFVAKMNR